MERTRMEEWTTREILSWAEQDGVDLSMLRERLRLTPTERLQRHQAALELVEAIKQATLIVPSRNGYTGRRPFRM
jgi:hypothetical protein